MNQFKSYTTKTGEQLLYVGQPRSEFLESLAAGPGDLWHSSLDYGFKNCFPELVYQTSVFWWFLNDFEDVDLCVSWRIDSLNFVIRERVWSQLDGFDDSYENNFMQGLDFGFTMLRDSGAVPLYVKGLFTSAEKEVLISVKDRYHFFAKYFKRRHSIYMLLRQCIFRLPKEYAAFKTTKTVAAFKGKPISLKPLMSITGQPKISVVIPTMKRQQYTQLLLEDYKKQTYPITEAIIIDATPASERVSQYYNQEDFDFPIKQKWQTTKGSCRARNEAIALCTGDYIIFADDDVRILPDFVENHIKLLQSYNAKACNGLDIMAEHVSQNLEDLKLRLTALGDRRWKVGVSHIFSNANSMVETNLVKQLIGNDVNFDGGYGEDTDFGLRILKAGEVLLHNPYAPNLHLKPKQGGYRFWGESSKLLGKKRKPQPWEFNSPVKWIRPVPSPTITYGILKHYNKQQIKEWRKKYFFTYLFKGSKWSFVKRLFNLMFKQLQFKRSIYYAKQLIKLGPRYE